MRRRFAESTSPWSARHPGPSTSAIQITRLGRLRDLAAEMPEPVRSRWYLEFWKRIAPAPINGLKMKGPEQTYSDLLCGRFRRRLGIMNGTLAPALPCLRTDVGPSSSPVLVVRC